MHCISRDSSVTGITTYLSELQLLYVPSHPLKAMRRGLMVLGAWRGSWDGVHIFASLAWSLRSALT